MKRAIQKLKLIIMFLLPSFGGVGGGFFCSCENRHTGDRMRFMLDSLQKENQAYTLFTSDSLQLELCRYFDRWGSSNERMKAYYLLGRAYHDMGEVPHALEIYQQAAEIADTTREDCDYRTLRAIYGQMGELFHWQNLPDEELKAWKKYSYFSLNNKDTLGYINGYELSIGAAFLNNDTAKILEITKHAHDLYKKYGYSKYAAGVYATTIYIYLNRSQYQKAKELMDVYEKESGYVDEKGNICKPHEIYYYSQGLYQLGINNLDSAEILFRKSALSGQPDAPAKGLLMVYEKRGNIDSISKYARLYADSYDSIYSHKMTETVQQITSMYNYSRHQRIAEQAEARAQRLTTYIIIGVMLLFVLLSIIYIYMKRRKQVMLQALARENNQYVSLLERFNEKEQQVKCLQEDSLQLARQYDNELRELKSELGKYQKAETKVDNLGNDIIVKFHDYARYLNGVPTKNELKEFEKYCMNADTDFMAFIGDINKKLDNRDRLICMLIRQRFIISEIAVLLQLSSSALSKRRRIINYKLFRKDSTERLDFRLKNL